MKVADLGNEADSSVTTNVRSCGAIEIAFKGVIADFCSYRGKALVKHFSNRRVRDGSANPSMHMIHKFLGDFDPNWTPAFKALLQQEAKGPTAANYVLTMQQA